MEQMTATRSQPQTLYKCFLLTVTVREVLKSVVLCNSNFCYNFFIPNGHYRNYNHLLKTSKTCLGVKYIYY